MYFLLVPGLHILAFLHVERGPSSRRVCSHCLEQFSTMLVDKFAPVCFGNHGPAYKKGFVWMTKDSPHIIVRPTPFNVGRMLERSMNYRCNHSYRDCYQRQRNVCIFPHNQTEEKWWNRWKTKRIDEISLTGVARQIIVKARRKSKCLSCV